MFGIIVYRNPKFDDPSCRHSGLGITASNLTEVLKDNKIAVDQVPVLDGFHLRAMMRANKWPGLTHVSLLAPFFDTPFLEKLCREFVHVEFTVTYHSNWGFLQQDHWAVKCLMLQIDLQARIRNFRISGNCREFCDSVLAAYGANCLLLPNTYYLSGAPVRSRPVWREGDLHIGMFGATRVLKNAVTGAAASLIIGRTVKAGRTFVHINTGRVERGDGILITLQEMLSGNKRAELVEDPWMSWPDFQAHVRWMDLMMQPSFTESFNNVTADGITQGVASVVGYPIGWVPDEWRACPDDACELAETGVRLLADTDAPYDGYMALDAHNKRALVLWKKWLA